MRLSLGWRIKGFFLGSISFVFGGVEGFAHGAHAFLDILELFHFKVVQVYLSEIQRFLDG